MINQRAVYRLGWLATVMTVVLSGCAEIEPKPYPISEGHIEADDPVTPSPDSIPDVVTQTPILPEPVPVTALEKYTVVVNEVPVKELLFALARDADLNVDLYPGIDGLVTLNAVDQTLPQILDRISHQVEIRYEFKDNNIIISPDTPFFKSYKIDYVNMTRSTTASNEMATQISTTGSAGVGGQQGGSQGGNNSTTSIESISDNLFWRSLINSIATIINDPVAAGGGGNTLPMSANVVANPESGVLNVRATKKQHEYIGEHVERVISGAQQQVVIQATIAEVRLSDQYQAGIDWQALDIADSSISIISETISSGVLDQTSSLFEARYDGNDFSSVLNLLEEFGTTNILSSPQLMVLNNQTAILKAVQNFVYFEIEADTTATQTSAITTVNSEVRTVPIGIVMAVTPQISDSGVITLNVRPTVSEIVGTQLDPAIGLIRAQIAQNNGGDADDIPDNEVPIIDVREMESMLRLTSGQTAILGGLMNNTAREGTNAIPGLSRIPLLGRAFETRTKRFEKSELVIFLRPTIIRNPNLDEDLAGYKRFLRPDATQDMSGGY